MQKIKFGSIFALEWVGEGPCVVLLHAAATGPHSLISLASKIAATGRRVVVPAFAGYGSEGTGTGMPAQADLARRVLDHVGRCDLFGHSMGGLIAVMAATPDRVRSLALYEPILHDILDPSDAQDGAVLDWDAQIIQETGRLIGAGAAAEGISKFVTAWNEVPFEALPETARAGMIARAQSLYQEAASLPGQGIRAQSISNCGLPVHLMVGSKSPAFCQRVGTRLAEAGVAVNSLDGCGHMGPIMAADKIFASVAAFWDGVD